MIEYIQINNVALIKSSYVEFGRGLNIISGETGSGKSMLINAVNFVFGAKVGKNFVRNDESEAKVSCLISIESEALRKNINALGVDFEEDNKIYIERTYNDKAKSVCKANGKLISLSILRELSNMFIDIHSQHQHQLLLNQSKHIQLLDVFCDEDINGLLVELNENLKEYKDVNAQIKNILGDEKSKAIKIDMLEFQINEIESVEIENENEDEILIQKRNKLQNSKALFDLIDYSVDTLFYKNDNAYDQVSDVASKLRQLAKLDDNCTEISDTIDTVQDLISGIKYDLKQYKEGLDADPKELERINSKINKINNLKRKYGDTLKEVLEFQQKAIEELDLLKNGGQQLDSLMEKRKELKTKISVNCKAISAVREEYSKLIEKEIITHLEEMGMKDIQFKVDITRQKEVTNTGYDKVVFMVATNKGATMQPLDKVASGGEMSRVMLALKIVLAKTDHINTFIFDEIDTGVSGRTAQKVGEKLKTLAKVSQVLCITHLPQIASMADNHVLIEKSSNETSTTTTIKVLDYEESVTELARLIGGKEITELTMDTAEEMKRSAMSL